jgi:hypothetical protein
MLYNSIMSTEQDRFNHSRRLLKDENAIKKQTKIAKSNGLDKKILDQPHRLAKHHAMDCGNPGCPVCGNPRKTHKDTLTVQEKKIFQDTEHVRDKHSNGLPPTQE